MKSSPIGISAFDSLRAEDEPWLDRCYVPPPDFDLIAGARSALVFGAPGSGKTALFRALQARLMPSQDRNESPSCLVVNWQPSPLESDLSGSDAAAVQLTHILGDCADALLAYLARWPDRFASAPEDVQDTLAWFISHQLGADTKRRVTTHATQAQETGRSLLHSFLSREVSNEWLSSASPPAVVAELVKALREVGPEAIYVLVGPDNLAASGQVGRRLRAFLSSLTLFENHRFLYKMVLPAELRRSIASAGALVRRRVRLYSLDWHVADLKKIVVKRTAAAIGEPVDTLAEICEDEKLTRWLERTGGNYPRGWLEWAAPLVAQYLRRRRTISTEEWEAIRENSPPPLTFSEDGSVTVGRRRVGDLSEALLSLLRYLYENRGRVCTRDELYHQAYLPARYPDVATDRHEYPAEYDTTLDTAISRLRKKIEPDPKSPVYVVTKRGEGYKLEHAW